MLPRRGDHYILQKYGQDGSPKEALKQKMLSQEYTFKKQVQELHRLYQIQTILMKNLRLNEVSTKQSASCSFQGISRRPMDDEVSTSHYVKHSDLHFLKKGHGWGTAENPVQVDQYFDGDIGSSEEVQLSLSINGNTMQNKSCKKIWDKKLTSISSQYIIDLEEPASTALSRDSQPKSALGCAACSVGSGNLHVFQISCSSPNGVNKYLDNGTKRSQSLIDETKNCLEQNSLDQGAKKWLGNLPSMGVSCATNMFPSCEAACIDLNKPPLDEAPHSEEYLVMDCSAGASSSVSERVSGEWHKGSSPIKPESRCISAIIKEDTLNITVMASNSIDSSTVMTGSKSLSVDLESCFKSPSDQSDVHDCLTGNFQHKDAKLVSNLPRKNHKGKTMIEEDDMRGEEDAMSPNLCIRGDNIEDEDIDSSPASFKSDCIGTDPSSSFKTVQSGTHEGKSDLSRMNSFQNSESSQDESSIHAESRSGSFDGKIEGSAQDDALIQKGAVSLMYFLLEISSREDDCIAEVDQMNEIEKGKRDQPECSSDTFESMVLKLQESNVEDYCVSSMPMEVNDTDKKDYGIRLRRGRRMKDFQKDILPGMASLARHEICEDIRIMEGVIRSREYKKLRSKMSNAQTWFTPVRSRRSRLNYIGRKYY